MGVVVGGSLAAALKSSSRGEGRRSRHLAVSLRRQQPAELRSLPVGTKDEVLVTITANRLSDLLIKEEMRSREGRENASGRKRSPGGAKLAQGPCPAECRASSERDCCQNL